MIFGVSSSEVSGGAGSAKATLGFGDDVGVGREEAFVISSGFAIASRGFCEAPFGVGDEVVVGAVEEGVSVGLTMLGEDGLLECLNLSLKDFFGAFAGYLGDGI